LTLLYYRALIFSHNIGILEIASVVNLWLREHLWFSPHFSFHNFILPYFSRSVTVHDTITAMTVKTAWERKDQ